MNVVAFVTKRVFINWETQRRIGRFYNELEMYLTENIAKLLPAEIETINQKMAQALQLLNGAEAVLTAAAKR